MSKTSSSTIGPTITINKNATGKMKALQTFYLVQAHSLFRYIANV